MTETSLPWGGTTVGHHGPYTDDQWSDTWRKIFSIDRTTEGVILGYLNELEVENMGDTVRINTGAAIIDGKFYDNDAVIDEDVTVNGTYCAVLGKDFIAQTVTGYIIAGDTPTQNDGTLWEVKLADVVRAAGVVTVTDARSFLHYGTAVSTEMLEDLSVTTAKIDTLAVDTGQVADDAIDGTKAGDNVLQLHSRKGGDSTNWSSPGTTTRTVGAVRAMVGVSTISDIGTIVLFPVGFSDTPVVIACPRSDDRTVAIAPGGLGIDGYQGFTATVSDLNGALIEGIITWIAIGPE